MINNLPQQSGYRETAWLLLSKVLVLLLALGLQSLLAYALTPEGMGGYGVWIGLAMVGAAVFSFGSDRAAQCRMIEGQLTVGQAIGFSSAMAVAGMLAAGCLCALGRRLGVPWLGTLHEGQCVLGLLLMGAVSAQTYLLLLLQGIRRFSATAILSVLIALLKLTLALVVVLLVGWGVTGALLASLVGTLLGVVAGGVYLYAISGSPIGLPSRSTFGSICRFALQYLPARWGNAGYSHAVILVLAIFAPIGQVGIFTLTIALTSPLIFIALSVSEVLLPRVCADKGGHPLLVARCCRLLAVTLGGLLVSVLFLGYVFVPILFSREFSSCVPLLWVVGIGIWMQGICNPLLPYVIGIGKPKVASVAVVARTIATLGSLPVLYSLQGLTGAALSMVLGQAIGSLVLIVYFHERSGMKVADVWLWNREDTDLAKWLLGRLLGRWGGVGKRRGGPPKVQTRTPIHLRQTFMTPAEIVKRQSAEATEQEWERTNWGREVAQRTGLFVVPAITRVDLVNGELHFERIDGLIPLREVLGNDAASADRLLRDAAQSLAALHDWSLPELGKQRPLSCWTATGHDSLVRIHGDYALCNLFYCRRHDKLAVLDWATTDRWGGEANVGPWQAEVCWLVRDLFCRRYWRFGLRDPGRLTELFVETYCRRRGHPIEEIAFYRFLLENIEAIYRAERASTANPLRKWTSFRDFRLVGRSLESKAKAVVRTWSPSGESQRTA